MFSLNEANDKNQQRLKAMQQECATMYKADLSDLHDFQQALMATQAKTVECFGVPAGGKSKKTESVGWMEQFQQTCASIQAATSEYSEAASTLAKSWTARRTNAMQSAQSEMKQMASDFVEKAQDWQKSATASVAQTTTKK
jgi:hypothetical protein